LHNLCCRLVEAIPDAAARAKIFGATARDLYFNGK
jgi:hypothetical protein